MEWYYELTDPKAVPNGMVEVDRMYCFDFDNFGDAEWERLTTIINDLPEHQPISGDGCPWWFGSNSSVPPYLVASVEPTGWLVQGVIPEDAWVSWHTQLQSVVSGLPRLSC